MAQPDSHMTRQQWILAAGIILVSLNLRPAITCVSALAERMASSGIGRPEIGSLTSIPLVLFGIVGLFSGWLGNRFGLSRAIGLGLLLTAVGCLVRSLGLPPAHWLLGSILIGSGIAISNVLMPSFVKRHFPERVGLLTALYSTAVNLGTAAGIATAVPIALATSWNSALAFWAVPVVVALVFWIPNMRTGPQLSQASSPFSGIAAMARQARAWHVALHFAFLAISFFSIVAWLPSVLTTRGMTEETAAGWVTAMQLSGCVISLFVPTIASRFSSQSGFSFIANTCTAVGLAAVWILPPQFMPVGVMVIGFGLNASFSLVLLMMPLRSPDAVTTGYLSAFAQSIAYLIASPGPWLIGTVKAATGTWDAPVIIMALAALASAIFGALAGKKGQLRPLAL